MKRIFALSAALALLCCLLGGCAADLAVNDGEESLPRVTSNVTSSPEPEDSREDDNGARLPGLGENGMNGNGGNGNNTGSGNGSTTGNGNGSTGSTGSGAAGGNRSGGSIGGSHNGGDSGGGPNTVIGRNADGTNNRS